jgi:hypothetical protein
MILTRHLREAPVEQTEGPRTLLETRRQARVHVIEMAVPGYREEVVRVHRGRRVFLLMRQVELPLGDPR